MEYQKISNLLDNALNQPSRFRTKNRLKQMMNHEEHMMPIMTLNLKLENFNDKFDTYIHVKETITIPNTGTAAAPSNVNRKVIFRNCAPFTNCMSQITNTQTDDANDSDVVMPMYDLIEYSDVYSKTGRL